MTIVLVFAVGLLAVVAYRLGLIVGWRRGFTKGFDLAETLAEETDSAYFQHYGGQIEAARRREN